MQLSYEHDINKGLNNYLFKLRCMVNFNLRLSKFASFYRKWQFDVISCTTRFSREKKKSFVRRRGDETRRKPENRRNTFGE